MPECNYPLRCDIWCDDLIPQHSDYLVGHTFIFVSVTDMTISQWIRQRLQRFSGSIQKAVVNSFMMGRPLSCHVARRRQMKIYLAFYSNMCLWAIFWRMQTVLPFKVLSRSARGSRRWALWPWKRTIDDRCSWELAEYFGVFENRGMLRMPSWKRKCRTNWWKTIYWAAWAALQDFGSRICLGFPILLKSFSRTLV